MIKNDKERVRPRCVGIIPVCGLTEGVGLGTTPKTMHGLTRGSERKESMGSVQ